MMEQQTTPVAVKEMEVRELVSRMRGELFRPSDVGYEQALRVYNGAVVAKLGAHSRAQAIGPPINWSCFPTERNRQPQIGNSPDVASREPRVSLL
jgi:hypothetical protein